MFIVFFFCCIVSNKFGVNFENGWNCCWEERCTLATKAHRLLQGSRDKPSLMREELMILRPTFRQHSCVLWVTCIVCRKYYLQWPGSLVVVVVSWRREFLKVLVVYPSSTLEGKLLYSVNYSLVCPVAPHPLPLPRSLSLSGPASWVERALMF